MAEVLRGKAAAFGAKTIPGYLFHGLTAIVALWLLLKAMGA